MRRAVSVIGALAVALAATACGGSDAPKTERTGSITWRECEDAESSPAASARIQCAKLAVPLDSAQPDGRKIELALARRPADGKRIGALVTNPGGPGASGVSLVHDAAGVFSPDVLERFDIVSWDPRGVGESAPIRCVDSLDSFYAVDHTPDDAAEVQANVDAARRLADGCQERSGDLLPYVSTRATVEDLDRIRAALGEELLTYVGFSYGTYIGALYAQQYPTHIRAMVLDGALDPSVGFAEASITQANGFDDALDDFLASCGQPSSVCEFGGDNPAESYDKVIAAIDAEPSAAATNGEERILGPGEADVGIATALYAGRAGWRTLSEVLDRVARGDGTGLMRLSDAYSGRQPDGSYDNNTEAFYAIGCLDGTAPATVDDVAAIADQAEQTAPRLGGATVWLGLPCTYWPVPPTAEAAPVSAPDAPPLVVIGTTRDPATPFSWAESLARQLTTSHLVTYDGEGHTAYGRGDECVDRAVDRYLIDLEPPEAGVRCG